MAEPQRNFVCLMPAIALVLACRSSDARRPLKERKQMAEYLTAIGPAMGITAGLAADWGTECRSLISVFDRNYHDITATSSQLREWLQRARVLFGEGRILEAPDQGKTMTQAAVENLMEADPVTYMDGRVHNFWGPGAKQEAAACMTSMSTVFSLAAERLQAEFPQQSLSVPEFLCRAS